MKHSDQINEISAALAKAQGIMTGAKRTGENDHFQSRYATLDTVWDAARKPLSENGLSVVQAIAQDEKSNPLLVTLLMHVSGQWISSSMPLYPKDHSPQSFGSALSYGRRYSLASMVGVVSEHEDDDGEHAMGRGKAHPKPTVVPSVQVVPKATVFDNSKRPITKDEWTLIATKIREVTKCSKDGVIEFVMQKTGKTEPKTLVFGDLLALENELGLLNLEEKLPF